MNPAPPAAPTTRWVALVGNPNTGKTSVFNHLTGHRARTGNFAGVTVERRGGRLRGFESEAIDLVDLPGTYSLAARSPDEEMTVNALLGDPHDGSRADPPRRPAAVAVVVDAANIERNLYLVTQVVEIDVPVVVILNRIDMARKRGIEIDAAALAARLDTPVIPCSAKTNEGLDAVAEAIVAAARSTSRRNEPLVAFPAAMTEAAAMIDRVLDGDDRSSRAFETRRALIDRDGHIERRLIARGGDAMRETVERARETATDGCDQLGGIEAKTRYAFIEDVLRDSMRAGRPAGGGDDRLDRLLTHRVFGLAIFVALMTTVFVSIFTWAAPLMDLIDDTFSALAAAADGLAFLGDGATKSLLVDGIIAGVGGIVIFLPQIVILFGFLALLEDCGYLSRAAFLMDRLLRWCGLSGQAFIPMLSSFACAIPGIMSTRTIASRRERMVTMLVAPLMSCSARIPVYAILIACFVPATVVFGFIDIRGFVFAAMYFVGIIVAIPVAFLLRHVMFREVPRPFLLEFPPYKRPSLRFVMRRMISSGLSFLQAAGTIILAASVIIWALGYFPAGASAETSAERLEQSYLGSLGRAIEPVVEPIGWDWKVGIAIIASFPAREIVVSTLGVIYRVGDDADEESEALRERLKAAKWERGPRRGEPVFTLATALALMVFFALCAQCMSTLAVIWRESGSWGWAFLSFSYMTALAYVAAWGVAAAVRGLGG